MAQAGPIVVISRLAAPHGRTREVPPLNPPASTSLRAFAKEIHNEEEDGQEADPQPETMVNLDNEPLAEANGGLSLPCAPSIPCMPTAIRTCQTCCQTSCS